MKKVLFATTALVASAGIASAQGIAISGSAEMGVVGGDRHVETQFFQSVDIRFSMTGETNGGLTFGATVDARDLVDMGQAGQDGTDIGGHNYLTGDYGFPDFTVFVSGDFGRVTMGDTDGAFDWALQEVAVGPGTIDDSHTFHAGWNGNAGFDGSYDGQVVRYDHGFGDFKFAVSVEVDDAGVGDPAFGIGGKYMASLGSVDLGIGVGYQTVDFGGGLDGDIVGVSFDAQFAGGFRAVLNYSSGELGAVEVEHFGIGAAYTFDAISVGANYGAYSTNVPGFADEDGFGIAVNYDLGGGAVVQFGYGTSNDDDGLGTSTTVSTDSYSLGIAMSF